MYIHFRWGGVQLFWAAFDMPMTVVSLKVALGLGKFDFWAFKKIIMQVYFKWFFYYFLKCETSNFLNPNETFNGTTVTSISKAAQNNWTHSSKVNTEWATTICLKILKQIVAFWVYSLHTCTWPLAECFMLRLNKYVCVHVCPHNTALTCMYIKCGLIVMTIRSYI